MKKIKVGCYKVLTFGIDIIISYFNVATLKLKTSIGYINCGQ